jgi:hypothetical protein
MSEVPGEVGPLIDLKQQIRDLYSLHQIVDLLGKDVGRNRGCVVERRDLEPFVVQLDVRQFSCRCKPGRFVKRFSQAGEALVEIGGRCRGSLVQLAMFTAFVDVR